MPQQHKLCTNPIGMFDSGVGGLTILRQVMQRLPNEHVLYYADTARMPYGDKSKETVVGYAIENTTFLVDNQIKLLVVACSTASTHAMSKLRELFNVPIVDVVEAGIDQAVAATQNQKIAVLGTKSTIISDNYQRGILERLPQANVMAIACPLLAPLVEENFAHPAARLIVREYLAPLKNSQVDTLLLGCTHYPLLFSMFQEELPGVNIIDPAGGCASMIAEVLARDNLLAKEHSVLESKKYQFYVSEDPEKFSHLAANFLMTSVTNVEKI